jgi:hypothetical protein
LLLLLPLSYQYKYQLSPYLSFDTLCVIPIQNKIIDYLMNDMPWTKTGQSLIFAENDEKYDTISVVGWFDDGSTRSYEFWFDITECFGNNK